MDLSVIAKQNRFQCFCEGLPGGSGTRRDRSEFGLLSVSGSLQFEYSSNEDESYISKCVALNGLEVCCSAFERY